MKLLNFKTLSIILMILLIPIGIFTYKNYFCQDNKKIVTGCKKIKMGTCKCACADDCEVY